MYYATYTRPFAKAKTSYSKTTSPGSHLHISKINRDLIIIVVKMMPAYQAGK